MTDNRWSGSSRADSDEDETHPAGSPRQDLRHALGYGLEVSLRGAQLVCVSNKRVIMGGGVHALPGSRCSPSNFITTNNVTQKMQQMSSEHQTVIQFQ